MVKSTTVLHMNEVGYGEGFGVYSVKDIVI